MSSKHYKSQQTSSKTNYKKGGYNKRQEEQQWRGDSSYNHRERDQYEHAEYKNGYRGQSNTNLNGSDRNSNFQKPQEVQNNRFDTLLKSPAVESHIQNEAIQT